MSDERIDVLGIMDRASGDLHWANATASDVRLRAARIIVGKLIDAAKEWRSAEIDMQGAPHDGERISACNRMIAAKDRLNAVLLLIGDAS